MLARCGAALALIVGAALPLGGQSAAEPSWQAFFVAAGRDDREARAALDFIADRWRDGYAAMVIDIARLLPPPRRPAREEELSFDPDGIPDSIGERPSGRGGFGTGLQRPGADIRRRLTTFLEKRTDRRFGDDLRAWRRWIWSLPYAPHPDYAVFKAELYGQIDPRFKAFFPPGVKTSIRLDEIDWGGVPVNGIPPLRSPKHVRAADASWLRDGHIVFGIAVNGEARAYPRRILAWHELATDRLGGVDLTIVYCTLCGTVIPYHSRIGGRPFTFGTSGLLYRSNKLMFDEETRSLWSSLEGQPVVGSLVGANLQMTFEPAVTTTWGEWRRDHPGTTVLSLETGFARDYSEGAAYRDYFDTDRLMFEVPETDSRLKNKAEVLVMRPEVLGPGAAPVAIAADRLRRQRVFSFEAGGRRFVVITSKEGANRVYDRGAATFAGLQGDDRVRDTEGGIWRVTAEALVSETGERLARIPAHRAFWFGWRAQHPETVLHK